MRHADLGLDLDPLDRRDHEDREVGGTQRGGDVADEVGVARGVEHVDLGALDLERRERERHRDPAPCLLGVEVGDGVAVLDLSEPRDGARGKSSASASDVLPAPPWPTRATLRICEVGNDLAGTATPRGQSSVRHRPGGQVARVGGRVSRDGREWLVA